MSTTTSRLPGARDVGRIPLHTGLVLVGLFTVSWDRLATIPVGTYNVKLPVLAFVAALAASFLTRVDARPTAATSTVRSALLLVMAAYALGVLTAASVGTAAVQGLTVVLGALVPYAAVTRSLRLGEDPVLLLTALVRGAVAVSVFGFYQLLAGYTGLPDPLPYSGLGGGVERLASVAYEPAYFAYFLVLALGAVLARSLLGGGPVSPLTAGILVAALLLTNSRAVVLMLPLLAALLYVGSGRRLPGRRTVLVATAVGGYLLVLAVAAVAELRSFLGERVGSIVDAGEPTSNAPRLAVYRDLLDLVRDHWVTGVGPGNIFVVGPAYGIPTAGGAPNSVVANNVWLQALADGGIVLALAQVAFVVVLVRSAYRRRLPASRSLMGGWLAVLVVGGMLTSWFWDVKLWVVAGLVVGLLDAGRAAGSALDGGPVSPGEQLLGRRGDPAG